MAKFIRLWEGNVVFQTPRIVILQQLNRQIVSVELPEEEIPEIDLEQTAKQLAAENKPSESFNMVAYRGTYLTFEPNQN